MNLSETDILLLEDYWADQLGEKAQVSLEERLAKDIDFQAAAAAWKLIVQESRFPPAEEIVEQDAIKERLLNYAAKPSSATVTRLKPVRRQRSIYIGLAAAAASVGLVWWMGGMLGQGSSNQEFFAHLDRENANLSNEVRNGKKAYDQRDYEAAYPALLAEVEAGEDSLNLIYASVAAIGSGQADKAIPILAPLVNQETWAFYQAEIQWYLVLAYLETGEEAKAIEHLQTVIDAKGLYAEEAATLMAKVKG